MRPQWNRGLGREIYVPRRPEEDARREIKRIDLQLNRNEDESHSGGGYFRIFDHEIPPRPQNQDQTDKNNETGRDTESTTSSNQEKAVATQEPGVYPAMPVQDYRDGPIEDIAVRINRVLEKKATRNKQRERNVRAAELGLHSRPTTLIKVTAAEPDLIELNCCMKDNNFNRIPNEYEFTARKVTQRLGIKLVGDRIIVPQTLRYAALNALHFGKPGNNKICTDATIFWSNMRADIEKKAKICSACLNGGKNRKFQLPLTKKTKIKQPKMLGEEIQIDFIGNLNNKKVQSSPYIIAVDKNGQ